ncbi:MAG: glycosyltransferase [Bacillaceae bacterium]|nr:glycosyltransferase [Bacillaceae bacterium]
METLKPEILILTETFAGEGHHMAARALEDALKHQEPSLNVFVDQALPRVSRQLEAVSRLFYMNTIRHFPNLWGWAYQRETLWNRMFQSHLSHISAMRLKPYLYTHNPDVIVTTHAYCLGGLAKLRARQELSFRLGAVITDFDVNRFWVHPAVDFYLVATPYLKNKLVEQGIDDQKIFPTGIPVRKEFNVKKSKVTWREELGFDREMFTILMSGGGTGWGPMSEILNRLILIDEPLQILFVAGKNKEMYHRVRQSLMYSGTGRHRIEVFGFVHNMHQLMHSADLLISKPGGITLSEALAAELPTIIYKPIPGQEERNARYLLEENVVDMAENLDELTEQVKRLLNSGKKREEMKERIHRLRNPDSSIKASRIILQHREKSKAGL